MVTLILPMPSRPQAVADARLAAANRRRKLLYLQTLQRELRAIRGELGKQYPEVRS
jgi:hypothetical protein